MTFGPDYRMTGAVECDAAAWPGDVGGVLRNREYEFNVAHDLLRRSDTGRVAHVVLQRTGPGQAQWSPAPADLESIVEGVRAFITDF